MTIKEKILKIMSLALDINPPENDRIGREWVEVFVNWSPHCPVLSVMIYLDGWKPHMEADTEFRTYTDWENAGEELDKMIEELEGLKEVICE